MKNAMQLKAILKNMAKQKNISAQLVLQNYMLRVIIIHHPKYLYIDYADLTITIYSGIIPL